MDESDVIGDGCSSKYWSLIHFHGLFMFLGWGLFLVAGVFIARFFKHKDPLWFHLHRIFQVTDTRYQKLELTFIDSKMTGLD